MEEYYAPAAQAHRLVLQFVRAVDVADEQALAQTDDHGLATRPHFGSKNVQFYAMRGWSQRQNRLTLNREVDEYCASTGDDERVLRYVPVHDVHRGVGTIKLVIKGKETRRLINSPQSVH